MLVIRYPVGLHLILFWEFRVKLRLIRTSRLPDNLLSGFRINTMKRLKAQMSVFRHTKAFGWLKPIFSDKRPATDNHVLKTMDFASRNNYLLDTPPPRLTFHPRHWSSRTFPGHSPSSGRSPLFPVTSKNFHLWLPPPLTFHPRHWPSRTFPGHSPPSGLFSLFFPRLR